MSDGDENLLADVVALFLAGTPAEIRELGAALDARDPPSAYRLAHRLKGSARSVGARQVGDLAAAIEAAAQGGDIDGASAPFADLEPAFDAAREALEREIS